MLKAERRTYRRSPGRQYGYDYDPLRSKHPTPTTGRLDDAQADERSTSSNRGRASQPTTGILAPRPDPRRTRQLLRQNILASKARSTLTLDAEQAEIETETETGLDESEVYFHEPGQNRHEEEQDSTLYRNRYPARHRGTQGQPRSRMLQHYDPASTSAPAPRTRRLPESERFTEQELVEWEPGDVDPDMGYEYEEEDPLDHRLDYSPSLAARPPLPAAVPRRASSGSQSMRSGRPVSAPEPEYDEDEEEELQSRSRRKQRKGITRRSLLWGLGLAAVGGGAVAAIELGPKLPQTLESAGTNIEHQLEDAFNKGVAAGAENVRKEFITALDSLEGVSLQAAVDAAHLTRMSYDVFVSPLVTLAATVTGDFLTLTLRALQTARGWLARIYQDNDTLAALQTVLETWVKQVNDMPKKLQTITDTDLDGAQAYLRALQHKLQQEQAKLNQQQATPTNTPNAKPTTTPKT